MNNIKKDFVFLYMLRNFLGTFVIVLCAFLLALIQYYDCPVTEAFQRIFVKDIFTLSYFILLWVFDYLVFETSKIICDMYDKIISYQGIAYMGVMTLLCLMLPILAVLKYNLFFLFLLIVLRMSKQFIKMNKSNLN